MGHRPRCPKLGREGQGSTCAVRRCLVLVIAEVTDLITSRSCAELLTTPCGIEPVLLSSTLLTSNSVRLCRTRYSDVAYHHAIARHLRVGEQRGPPNHADRDEYQQIYAAPARTEWVASGYPERFGCRAEDGPSVRVTTTRTGRPNDASRAGLWAMSRSHQGEPLASMSGARRNTVRRDPGQPHTARPNAREDTRLGTRVTRARSLGTHSLRSFPTVAPISVLSGTRTR